MSNAKQIHIEGIMPFNCDENEVIKGWLASMNTPCFGLHIEWGKHSYSTIFNEHSGETAIYAFRISGTEAVAWSAIDLLLKSIKNIGGTVNFKKIDEY